MCRRTPRGRVLTEKAFVLAREWIKEEEDF